jgi:glycosyltransferase involved in cell wall biosynthesis
MKKPKILFLIRHFTPDSGYGGPINSLNGILKLGVNSGNNLVITSNRYFRSNMVMDVISDRWISYSGSRIFYSSSYLKLLIEFLKFQFDTIYLNGIFSPGYSIVPFILCLLFTNKNIIISPRSELSAECLNIKREKKVVFLFFFKFIYKIFNHRIKWHSTNNDESNSIREVLAIDKINIVLAENISLDSQEVAKKILNESKEYLFKQEMVKVIFASRISKKKNLLKTIMIFKYLPSFWTLDIVGTIDDEEEWIKCLKLINEYKLQERITYKGVFTTHQIIENYFEYNIAILLTSNENYGHSIAESLAAGIPLITTQNHPWVDVCYKSNNLIVNIMNENHEISQDIQLWYSKVSKDFTEHRKKSAMNYLEKENPENAYINYKKLFNN